MTLLSPEVSHIQASSPLHFEAVRGQSVGGVSVSFTCTFQNFTEYRLVLIHLITSTKVYVIKGLHFNSGMYTKAIQFFFPR